MGSAKPRCYFDHGINTHRTEQEQDDGSKATNATSDGTPEDTTGRSDRGILGLFSNVARGIESDQNTSRSQVRQTPVPAFGSAGSVVGCHERLVGRAETPSVGSTNGQPDQVEEEVQHDKASGHPEDISEVAS